MNINQNQLNTMKNYLEFRTQKELKSYSDEVKKNNINVIGTSSESPLEVGQYDGVITGNMSRIVGKTNDNDWCIFLTEVKVSSGEFVGVLDRIPFQPTQMLKKNTTITFEIYKDRKDLKRGRIVE